MSYVITGNPGVGKHTLTKEISKILHLPVIDINDIAKEFELLEKSLEFSKSRLKRIELEN